MEYGDTAGVSNHDFIIVLMKEQQHMKKMRGRF